MTFLTTSLLSVSVALGTQIGTSTASPATPVPYHISQQEWVSEVGDRFLVDTKENQGYLIHTDGRYIKFPVVTGQNRYVYYLGRSYKATTPTWDWVSTEITVKGDRLTFGKTGRFLRLFKDGDERTAYGIHGYGREEDLFSEENAERFRSMGCIIVREEMLDIIQEIYELNGNRLEVKTQFGIDDQQQIVAWFAPKS